MCSADAKVDITGNGHLPEYHGVRATGFSCERFAMRHGIGLKDQ